MANATTAIGSIAGAANNTLSSEVQGVQDELETGLANLTTTLNNLVVDDIFPRIELPYEASACLAALFIVVGLLCCVLGQRFLHIFLAVTAFVLATFFSMYPIDAIAGSRMCPDLAESREFCPWAFVLGMAIGLVAASTALRVEKAAIVALGASTGMMLAFLLHPVVSLALSGLPKWTHFMHYVVFGAAGAAGAHKYRDIFAIVLSSMGGAFVFGFGVSFYAG